MKRHICYGIYFESSTLCGYVQDQSDEFDWTRSLGQGYTGLRHGPAFDHTLSNTAGVYKCVCMYRGVKNRVDFIFFGLWTGNFFLIAPFPDHCLFVLFFLHNLITIQTNILKFQLTMK